MLGFFQRYQRFFFIFVTVIVVASFAFFGALDTFARNDKELADVQIGEIFDGSPMMRLEVQNLSRFLATDSEDTLENLRSMPNLCNDGVIRKDLLRTGIADLLVAEYFEGLREDLKQRQDRAERYRGYEHPEAPFISVRSVWDQFIPSIPKELDAMKGEKEVSLATFSHLSHLYQQQASCPPEFLKRVLMYYANQASWVKPDPYLQYADLSLFGFHSVSDWFGSNFVDLCSQFILNGAKLAEKKGYQVTSDEAKGDLLRNFQVSMQAHKNKYDPSLTWRDLLQALGMQEKDAVESWRKVLLFRRYFHTVGEATFVDSLPYRDFAAFAKESFVVQKYGLPSSLHLKTAQDLFDFQVYLHSIGGKLNEISLPTRFLEKETIEKQTPEFVQTTYKMKVARVSLQEVGLQATLKQVIDWQIKEENWKLLVAEFPFLEKMQTREERFHRLENLSLEQRKKVDSVARLHWARQNSQAVEEQLSKAPFVEKTVFVAQNWISLSDISHPRELGILFDLAANGEIEMKRLLEKYSDREDVFYRFESIEKIEEAHILTFKEAKELGVATLVADRFLETEYQKIRSQFPSQFQVKEGEWKLFSSVKEDVARIVFKDLIRKIGKEKESLAYYALHRLEIPAKEALAAFQKNRETLPSCEDPIQNQFKFVKNECVIQRTTKDEWMKEQVFIMTPNEWSPVYVPADGEITFFYFERKQENQEPILEQISFSKEVIAADAQKYVASSLLTKTKQKKSIVIPMHNQEVE